MTKSKTQYVVFNANHNIKVRLKDKGIEHIVKKHNEILPFKQHTSFNEYKKKADEFGYHEFQLWDFLDLFGGLGWGSSSYFDINIILESNNLKPFEFNHDKTNGNN